MRPFDWNLRLRATAALCSALLVPGEIRVYAQEAAALQPAATAGDAAPLNQGQLESLVAPIALYPDELLGQVLAASTYPLEVVEARRWVSGSSLKGQDLVKAAAGQNWEPSVEALVVFPAILQQMDENLKWTTALGNAFLAQQQDVMAAIQNLRAKAQAAGTLQSNAQQNVGTQQADGSNVIVIQPADPQVIYVPSYNPAVVYGEMPVYPYPAMTYPSTGALIAEGAIAFGAGVVMGSYFSGWDGGWGWGVHWGPHANVYINNNFINRYNYHGGGRVYTGSSGTATWEHNAAFRRGVPYSSAAVAGRYGSAAGIRTPRGAAGAVSGPDRSAAGITTPRVAAGATTGPRGSAGEVTTPFGSAARVQTPQGSAWQTPKGTFTNPRPNAFEGGGSRAWMDSQRGASSLSDFRGGGFGGGGFRGGGGGFRGRR